MTSANANPDPLDRVRHDMKSPLAVIKGHAQLAARDIGRFAGLSDAERERLQRHLSAIDRAVDDLAGRIDGLGEP
jgi:signal transduction histidine kinase